MKPGFILLCRFNSSRLPGKILKEINGKLVIDYIVERLSFVTVKDSIVIATSNLESDDPIEAYCKTRGLKCFRGSLDDVAGRFLACAQENSFDFAFRINGDNIFVDIELVKEAAMLANTGNYSFISNVHNRTFPKGMSIEGVNIALFADLLPKFDSYQREHVMPYFYENAATIPHFYIYNSIAPELAGIQLAIDTEEDYTLAKKIIKQFSSAHWDFGLREISKILKNIHEK